MLGCIPSTGTEGGPPCIGGMPSRDQACVAHGLCEFLQQRAWISYYSWRPLLTE